MVTEGEVEAVDGSRIAIRADVLVVHSDTGTALQIATATRTALEQAEVDLVPVR